jgi:hypothetical protein
LRHLNTYDGVGVTNIIEINSDDDEDGTQTQGSPDTKSAKSKKANPSPQRFRHEAVKIDRKSWGRSKTMVEEPKQYFKLIEVTFRNKPTDKRKPYQDKMKNLDLNAVNKITFASIDTNSKDDVKPKHGRCSCLKCKQPN